MTKTDIEMELGISSADAKEAIKGLIAKGLLIEVLDDQGVPHYEVTPTGVVFHEHMDSDPGEQN